MSDPLLATTRLPLICAPMFLVSVPPMVTAGCNANMGAAVASASARSAGNTETGWTASTPTWPRTGRRPAR